MSNPKAAQCGAAQDAVFGPGIGCSQFDFTITFEQAIFGIGVSSLFLICLVGSLPFVIKKRAQLRPNWLQPVKLVLLAGCIGIRLALLILWVRHPVSSVTVPAAALEFASVVAALVLVGFEHNRSIRPSSLLLSFLIMTITTEAVETRTLFIRGDYGTRASLQAASVACKAALFLFECIPKTSFLKVPKEYSPEETASMVSRNTFWWLNKVLLRGNRHILSIDDLYPLDKDLHSDDLLVQMNQKWDKHQSDSPYSFIWTHISAFKWAIIWSIPIRLAISAFTYAQTFLITDAVNYLDTPSLLRNKNHAYGLIGATALIYIGIAVSTANFYQRVYKIVAAFRGATSAIIYQKSLVQSSAYSEMAAVTLMSTDIDRMTFALTRALEIWAQFLDVAIGVWLLWRQIGAIAIAPIIVTVLCFVIQSRVSKPIGSRQAKWVAAVQRRVSICSTILRQMKSVKLSGLVEQLADLVQSERVRELWMAKQFRALQVWIQVISQMPNTLSALVAFAAYAIKASINGTPQLTTSQAFTSFAILSLLTSPASQFLQSIPMMISAMGCVKRVHKFINAKPFEETREITDRTDYSEKDDKSDDTDEMTWDARAREVAIVSFSRVVIFESENSEKSILTFDAYRGSLTLIMGPVACGKSTLLRTIIGEHKPASGSISVATTLIGFCAQSPWLPNETVRGAIIGANEYEEKWFSQVIDVCQLERDFSEMPKNDLTIMGNRGITLSGGQKHRVALARALYSRCSILVLDDFFSSLDRKTRDAIAQRLFTKDGHIKKHGLTVLLATHIPSYADLADNLIIMGSSGTLEYVGPPSGFTKSELQTHVSKTMDDQDDLPVEDTPKSPKVLELPMSPGLAGAPISSGIAGTAMTPAMAGPPISSGVPRPLAPNVKPKQPDLDTEETSKRQSGDAGVWLYYAKSIGLWPILIATVSVCVSVFMSNFPKLWLQWNTGGDAIKVGLFVGIFALVSVIAIAGQASFIYQNSMVIGVRSGIRLHDILVRTVFAAPMSFFEVNDSSLLLNRFSQDMSLIDMQLPMSSSGVIISLATCVMNLILICLGSTYIAISVPGTLVVLYLVQKFYLRTSRQMRLLDLEHKSPLYRQFTETLEGLETIRAAGWQEFSNRNALEKLDTSQRPYYLLYMIQRWLNFVLDCVVLALAVSLVSLALCLPSSSSGGSIGVALSSILSFNVSLKMLIMTWTMAETSLGSVARTQSFEKYTPSEEGGESLIPEASWPSGQIDVSNMTLSYQDGTTALHNVNFSIKAGQKFGICGRTGSGKSTLLSSFMRLVDPSHGAITIDGIDISKVPRNTIRNRLICLPQDALIFPGTFRFNLDPVSKIPDPTILISMLQRVGLWAMVEKRGGLEADLKTDSLSHGEQQLLALARALVRKKIASDRCILVLDEATSNLDRATEMQIQQIIKEEFEGNTVVTVAHRLETVMEADCILLLERGEVVKMGPPREVL